MSGNTLPAAPAPLRAAASSSYYDIISAARALPLHERQRLADALHLDVAAFATYEVLIERSPDITGNPDPHMTHFEVYFQDPENTMEDARTHVSTTVRLRRPIEGTRRVLTQQELNAMPSCELRNTALDLIDQAQRRPLANLVRQSLHSSTSKQRLGVQILEGVDEDDLETAVEGLTRRLVA